MYTSIDVITLKNSLFRNTFTLTVTLILTVNLNRNPDPNNNPITVCAVYIYIYICVCVCVCVRVRFRIYVSIGERLLTEKIRPTVFYKAFLCESKELVRVATLCGYCFLKRLKMPSWPWSSKKDGERSCYVTPKANDEEPSTGNLSSDLSKGSFPEATYSPSIKEDQIKALLYKIIGIIERKEGSLYDFQLNAPVGNGRASMVGARVFLPRQFPVERPGWL